MVLSGVLVRWQAAKIFNLQMRAQGCNNRGNYRMAMDQSDCLILCKYIIKSLSEFFSVLFKLFYIIIIMESVEVLS